MTKVLIVEDDPIMLKIYHKKFQLEGFEVDTAVDGEEGFSKTRTFLPDVIVMDVMLPKLNGIAAMVRIKSDPKLSKIPVLVLSNLSTTDDVQVAMQKGAAAFLVKSDVTPIQVVSKVKEILKI